MAKEVETTTTIRERRFVNGKLKGMNNTQAAIYATGTKSKDVAKKQGSRLSTSANVQTLMEKALLKLKITPAKLLKVYAEALEARKTVVHGKDGNDGFVEVVPDHNIRMRAADRFAELLGMKSKGPALPDGWKQVPSGIPTLKDNPNVQQALDSGNEVELQRMIFKKEA